MDHAGEILAGIDSDIAEQAQHLTDERQKIEAEVWADIQQWSASKEEAEQRFVEWRARYLGKTAAHDV